MRFGGCIANRLHFIAVANNTYPKCGRSRRSKWLRTLSCLSSTWRQPTAPELHQRFTKFLEHLNSVLSTCQGAPLTNEIWRMKVCLTVPKSPRRITAGTLRIEFTCMDESPHPRPHTQPPIFHTTPQPHTLSHPTISSRQRTPGALGYRRTCVHLPDFAHVGQRQQPSTSNHPPTFTRGIPELSSATTLCITSIEQGGGVYVSEPWLRCPK